MFSGHEANKSMTEAALQVEGGEGAPFAIDVKPGVSGSISRLFKRLLRHPVDCLISINVATFKIYCSEL